MNKEELAFYLRSEILTKIKMLKELTPEATFRFIDTEIMPAQHDFSDCPINGFISISFPWE